MGADPADNVRDLADVAEKFRHLPFYQYEYGYEDDAVHKYVGDM